MRKETRDFSAANIYPRISLISTFRATMQLFPQKFRKEKQHFYAGARRRGMKRVSHAMYGAWKAGRGGTRTRERESGSVEGLKLLRGIGKIFELPRQSNYELRCGTMPTLCRCARAFAHTGTPSSPQWKSRETRNFRSVLSSGRARMAGWIDGWMDDTVKKTSM